jgi:hypothetical protein
MDTPDGACQSVPVRQAAAVRGVGRLLVTLIALAAIASCGEAGGRATPEAFEGTQPPGTYEAEATAVSRPEPGVLQLTLKDIAVGCTKKPHATVEVDLSKDRDSVYLTVVQDVVAPAKDATCKKTGTHPLAVRLDTNGAKASQVIVNNEAWGTKDQIGELKKCEAPFGCEGPPADHCDRSWIDLLLSGVEIAPERQVDTVACDGTWLILDVDAVISGCESRDGVSPPSGCAGKGTHTRWFARFNEAKPAGWNVVASGTTAGCAVPDARGLHVPRSLCRDLPARGR